MSFLLYNELPEHKLSSVRLAVLKVFGEETHYFHYLEKKRKCFSTFYGCRIWTFIALTPFTRNFKVNNKFYDYSTLKMDYLKPFENDPVAGSVIRLVGPRPTRPAALLAANSYT